MSLLSAVHFLRPWWLLALLVLPLIGWWWQRRAQQRNPWRDVVDAHLLPHLLEASAGQRASAWPRWLAPFAAALAIIALAGPGFGKDEQPLWQAQEPLVIALDLSSATLARDLPPTRLAQARAKLATLLRERAGGQVALVAFAGNAFTVAPLTEDAANIALFLDALDPGVMPEDGHRTDRAIEWSQGLMRQAGFARGQILLLTDRADGTDIAAAAKANAAGYRVSVLGLGTAQGGVFDTPEGLGQARLDASALQRLASSGGGGYQALSPGDADLRALGVLDPRQDAGTSVRGQKVSRWRDDGYWLLPVVLLLCLPLFRRGAAFALLLACGMWLPMAPASAQAKQPSAGSLWQRADQAEHARMQDGIAAYKRKDYSGAIERFSTVGGAEGQYNLGNALAKAGRYDDAIAAYDRALALQPGLKDAAFNRNLVRLAKRMPKRPQDQGESKDGKGGQPQPQKPGQPGQQDKPQAPPSQGRGEQARKPSPPTSQPAQDAQSQAKADAAQRERMQEALQQQGKRPGQQPASGERDKPAETAEQRERRLANEAWLQRVPDDPGALLRARFLLEQQRRRGATP
ncbi:VWA domain-containing protein [Thermomonas carbonis]|uniref:VWA domain-containing protein n=1 Tax=Thermomonas carbonis TaxID=1463158 RepID=A0A7G9SRI4_9GAMM|nr:VWA domain-containing protein [Thermomonas carbonis]QNN70459.1 VWA domain-containing protein [Thermomonas carbonis]GHC00155.1 membrane protein [Thermomonas carbonis]